MKLKDILRLADKTVQKYAFPDNFACALCGIEIFEGFLCPDCLKTVEFNDGITCPVCGRKTAKAEVCIECKANLPEYKKAVSPLVYRDGGIGLVMRFKRGNPWLADTLARLAAPKLADLPKPDVLVYVPMTERAIKRRGYNQAALFARKLGDICNIPVADAIEKVKESPEQKGLTRAERIKNLDGCFKVDKSAVNGKTVLVADDVLTTGATLDEICKKLKSAGACAVFAVTIASVEYKIKP